MTGLVFSETPDNKLLRRFGHDFLVTTLGQSIEATVADPTLAPAEMLAREGDLARARGLEPVPAGPGEFGLVGGEAPGTPEEELSEFVDPEALNKEFGHLGLKFDVPTRRAVAEIMARNRLEELIRQDVINRGPQGFLPGAARLGAAFARAAIDPLNVAAAFMPVVSQARFAGMVARSGVTRARFSKGVIEGTVGNVAIEPAVAVMAERQQLDYTMADALINVAFGGLLGGGLHVGAGRISDLLSRASPDTREQLLRASVAQVAEGRRPKLDTVVAFDPYLSRTELLGSTSLTRPGRSADIIPFRDLAKKADEKLGGRGVGQATEKRGETVRVPLSEKITATGEVAPKIFTKGQAQRAARKRPGSTLEQVGGNRFLVREDINAVPERDPGGAVKTFASKRAAQKFIDRVRGGDEGLQVVRMAPGKKFGVVRATPEDAAKIDRAPALAEFEDVVSPRVTKTRAVDLPKAHGERMIQQAARQETAATRDYTGDPIGYQETEAFAKTSKLTPDRADNLAAEEELQILQDQLTALQEQGVVSKFTETEQAELDAITKSADDINKAIEQAAICMTTRI